MHCEIARFSRYMDIRDIDSINYTEYHNGNTPSHTTPSDPWISLSWGIKSQKNIRRSARTSSRMEVIRERKKKRDKTEKTMQHMSKINECKMQSIVMR